MKQTIGFVTLALVAAGCGKKQEATPAPAAGSGSASTARPESGSGSGSAGGAGAAGSGSGSSAVTGSSAIKLVIKDVGFATPESVLYDPTADLYYVSNINGAPTDADDNGFISKVKPDGTVVELKWIDGAKDDIKLDAPKGTAITGDSLWVADITSVRRFDLKTGKQTGDFKVEGATFLNDVTAGGGSVFVTDMGVDAKFASNGSDAIYALDADGKVGTVMKDKALGSPNGIFYFNESLFVASFGSGAVYGLDNGEIVHPQQMAKGKLDGLIIDPTHQDTHAWVSSWDGRTIYAGTDEDKWTDMHLDIESPADIGWDSKRQLLLVPSFMGNTVSIVAP